MALVPIDGPARVSQVLIDILGGDPDERVRVEAAKTIWRCESEVNCKYAINALKDEIDYGTERSIVGPSRARNAIQLLLNKAPNQEAKNALQKLIN